MRVPFAKLLDVVLVCATVGILGVILEQRLRSREQPSPPSPFAAGIRMADVPGVSFGAASRTLMIVTRTGCTFCQQSADFWQRLARDSRQSRGLRIVAVSSDPVDMTREFLARHGIAVDQVVSARVPTPGTPTLVLVGQDGTVQQSWLGKPQSRAAENAIIETVM